MLALGFTQRSAMLSLAGFVLVATACHVRATRHGASSVEDRSVEPH